VVAVVAVVAVDSTQLLLAVVVAVVEQDSKQVRLLVFALIAFLLFLGRQLLVLLVTAVLVERQEQQDQ
jgi:hypothetical protein